MRRPGRPRTATVLTAAALLVLAGCGDDDPTVDIDAGVEAPEETEEPDEPIEDDPAQDEPVEEDPVDEPDDGPAPQPDAAPEPDAALVADPCGPHADREGESFLELAAPVDGQAAAGTVELVGCAVAFEGTVSYRLVDAAGTTLDEGFTTAECGGPCVGAFDDDVDLAAAGDASEVTLQVFEVDASDGSDRNLTEVTLLLR